MKKKLLLIGASTGGPSQIKELLSFLRSFSHTIILLQHMKEEVLPFFVKDLQNSLKINILITPLSISFAKPSIIVCSHSSILIKKGNEFKIITDKNKQNYTPDINKFFNSCVKYYDEFDMKILIMTGIGKDGVEGAKNLKNKGAYIIAQDENSSPVFGMPKAAIENNIVDEVKSFTQLKDYMRKI